MMKDCKQEYSLLKNEIRHALIEEIDFTKELEEQELLELIDEKIRMISLSRRISLEDRTKLRKEVFRSLRQLDVLQELIEDPQITEIMINGTERIFLEREGKLIKWDNAFESEEKLNAYAETLLPCVYDDFISTAKEVLTPEHREGLRKLLNFKFKKHPRYNLSNKRLKLIEKQIQARAKMLLDK